MKTAQVSLRNLIQLILISSQVSSFQVQALYSSYGISLNNKHIEVLLNQLINEVVIATGGQSEYEIVDKVSC
ncbi:MAG: hypothetical protein ACTS6G_05180 [Candidatus Hodgkinia cicadicola]